MKSVKGAPHLRTTKSLPRSKKLPSAKGLSGASARMKAKGTVGAYTARAGGKKNIGKQIKADLAPGSGVSGTVKKRANFARMARRGFQPLGEGD